MRKSKKFTAVLLAVIMALSVVTSISFSATAATTDEAMIGSSGKTGECVWSYDDRDHRLTISGNGAMENYDLIRDYYAPWHDYRGMLDCVVIENGVTNIGNSAFYWLPSLESVTIPNSVTSIGTYAFCDCIRLESVTIPDSVTFIGSSAFDDCESLTSITIPDSVTVIGNNAFADCEKLASIAIHDSLTGLGYGVFHNTAWYNNMPDGLVYVNKFAYKYKGTMPENTSIEIKEGTKYIVEDAFLNCTGLTSITIPDSLISIGDSAFYDCTSLVSVTIGNSVTYIGGCAFDRCESLESVTIPENVTSIGTRAFEDCTSLKSITIPKGVTSIGDNAFGFYFSPYYTKIDDFTIYGYKGTAAETYAKENEFKFIALDEQTEPSDSKQNQKVYFDNSTYNWSSVYAYIYDNSASSVKENAAWPGEEMSLDSETGYYVLEIPEEVENGKVIFTESSSATINRYPADMEEGLALEGATKLFTANRVLENYNPYATAPTAEPTTPTSTDPTPDYKFGDVDLDGEVNVKDATLIQRIAVEDSSVEISDAQKALADVDGDGEVNVKDATCVLLYSVESITGTGRTGQPYTVS